LLLVVERGENMKVQKLKKEVKIMLDATAKTCTSEATKEKEIGRKRSRTTRRCS
jgi:hypothetical protein